MFSGLGWAGLGAAWRRKARFFLPQASPWHGLAWPGRAAQGNARQGFLFSRRIDNA